MVGNYVKIERVLEAALRDLPDYVTYSIETVVEWVWEASREIGLIKDKNLLRGTLEGNQIKLPADIEDVLEVRYGNTKLTYRDTLNNYTKYTYTIYNGYLYSDLADKDITILVSYLNKDERGYPLLPDIQYVITALQAYIAERIAFKLYLQDKLNENKYQRYRNSWLNHRNSANVKSKLPRQDEDARIAKEILTILPTTVGSNSIHTIPEMNIEKLNDLVVTQNRYESTT